MKIPFYVMNDSLQIYHLQMLILCSENFDI